MKKLLKSIITNKIVLSALLKTSIKLHNYLYKVISVLVVFDNKGIHPKHGIMNYHDFFIENVGENDLVLDIGCGNGFLAYDVAEKAKKVTGIDILKTNVDKANKNYKRDNLEFILGDATTFRFGEEFDVIILSNVLEHIDERVELLKSLHKLSSKILIRVPMIDRDWLAVYKKENGYEYRLDDTHFIEFTEEILKNELKLSGWELGDYSIKFGELWGVVEKHD